MKWIRLLVQVENARGLFLPGDEVCWPDHDAQPLLDSEAAEEFDPFAVIEELAADE